MFQFGKKLKTKILPGSLKHKEQDVGWWDTPKKKKNQKTTESSGFSSSKVHTGIKSIIASKVV